MKDEGYSWLLAGLMVIPPAPLSSHSLGGTVNMFSEQTCGLRSSQFIRTINLTQQP